MAVSLKPNDFVIVVSPGRGPNRVTFGQLRNVGTVSYLHPLNHAYEDMVLTKKHKVMGKVIRRQKDY